MTPGSTTTSGRSPRADGAVKLLAEHVRTSGFRPVQVLCSSARRTLETLRGRLAGRRAADRVGAVQRLRCEILDRLRQIPDEIESVMVIGHNPAMQMLVLRLAGANRPSCRGTSPWAPPTHREVQRKFPTGALATLTFDCAWSELGPGCAHLTAYVRACNSSPTALTWAERILSGLDASTNPR